ncbi:MAG: HPr(Ser) kinase/phosphatase [Candidatus Heteroscillospira sp.]|jgi:HPr kinase/phosphorylase
MNKYTVKLTTLVKELELEVLHASSEYESTLIETADVNRPGLQLTGFYDYFDHRRVQVLGRVEAAYLKGYRSDDRLMRFEKLMERKPVAVVICHQVEIYPECIQAAEKYDVNLLVTTLDTSEFMAVAIEVLRYNLAPRETRHGVLVDIYGEGVLITGESGIGKSEAALELVKRGHRLIADDAVEIKRTARNRLVGQAPEMIRHYMELRGIGLINIRTLYGVGAVKTSSRIELVVNLETWEKDSTYERLGLENQKTNILGVDVPSITVPIRPGRNLAVILETAAMNNRMKKMGYNAAQIFVDAHDSGMDAGGWISRNM